MTRRVWAAPRRAIALGLLVCASAAFPAALARATTGPGYLLEPPKYRISLAVLKAYTGRYVTTSTAKASKITSSELYVGVAESGYAAGGISIYSYNAQGTLQSFAGTLYNFHVVSGGQVESDIVAAGGKPVLGHLFVKHAPGSKNLVGTVDPPEGGGPFAVAYRFAASGGPLPGQANTPVPGPPNPGTVSGSALNNSSSTSSAAKPVPGWGATARFLGRYHLIPGTVAAPSPQAAGIFSVALSAAAQLAAAQQRPSGGQLSLFMRTVKKTEPPVPSGILSVDTPASSTVIYLTLFTSSGQARSAVVNGGSFLGPAIGTFKGTSVGAGLLSGQITAQGIGSFSVDFQRFSTSPTP